jgi:hypothetical protein
MSDTVTLTAPGWYSDPEGVHTHQAYWDGEKWTGATRPQPTRNRTWMWIAVTIGVGMALVVFFLLLVLNSLYMLS